MTNTETPRKVGRPKKAEKLLNLHAQGVGLLKDIDSQSTRLTALYKEFAEVVVELRKQFKHNDKTDWQGRSQAYRDAVAAIYEEAGVPTDSEAGHQANIRYHVGVILREKLTAKQREEAGIKDKAERQAADESPQPRRNGTGTAPGEDPDEWIRDSVSSLQSVQEDHPELIVLDLSALDVDVTALLRAARESLAKAREAGVVNAVPLSVAVRLLTEAVAEAGAMLVELEAIEPPSHDRRSTDVSKRVIDTTSHVKEKARAA